MESEKILKLPFWVGTGRNRELCKSCGIGYAGSVVYVNKMPSSRIENMKVYEKIETDR